MENENRTIVTYFIIIGFSDNLELQESIFFLVLFIYLLNISGNTIILLLVCLDPQLHTPMYFFLWNLSLIDILSPTVTLNHVFTSYIFNDNNVSFNNCMIEIYLFCSLACSELSILTVMSYDRYVAICNPLHYSTVMSNKVTVMLITGCWFNSFLLIVPIIFTTAGLTCYTSNKMNHFFCDIVPLMKLTCSDTSILEKMILIDAIIFGLTQLFLILSSYVFIINAILKIQSRSGREKAFYTCSSHLSVVILLYATITYQYHIPNSRNRLDLMKMFSLLNTAIVPLLNPFIYSLKNKDVMLAVRRQLRFRTF